MHNGLVSFNQQVADRINNQLRRRRTRRKRNLSGSRGTSHPSRAGTRGTRIVRIKVRRAALCERNHQLAGGRTSAGKRINKIPRTVFIHHQRRDRDCNYSRRIIVVNDRALSEAWSTHSVTRPVSHGQPNHFLRFVDQIGFRVDSDNGRRTYGIKSNGSGSSIKSNHTRLGIIRRKCRRRACGRYIHRQRTARRTAHKCVYEIGRPVFNDGRRIDRNRNLRRRGSIVINYRSHTLTIGERETPTVEGDQVKEKILVWFDNRIAIYRYGK